jgi:hypothetical protein
VGDDGDDRSFFDGRCPSLANIAPSALHFLIVSPEGAIICLHRAKPYEKGSQFLSALKGRYSPPQGEALCIIGEFLG